MKQKKQEEVKIRAHDGHIIYGTKDMPRRETKSMIIFVHGLAQHQNEHIFYNAARFFTGQQYATFRFDLYSGRDKGRSLSECTLETHAKDINHVLGYWNMRFANLFLIGHSLGAVAALLSDLSHVGRMVLWAPPYDMNIITKYAVFDERLGTYMMRFGVEYIIHPSMYQQWKTFPSTDNLIAKAQQPIKIICAERDQVVESWKKYFASVREPKNFSIIEDAGHTFDEHKTEEKLFTSTLNWFM